MYVTFVRAGDACVYGGFGWTGTTEPEPLDPISFVLLCLCATCERTMAGEWDPFLVRDA